MNSSSISQLQNTNVGKTYFNPYIGIGSGNKTRQQCRVAAPTKIVNCDRDRIPMSQLTSPFESIGNGNHFSQDNNGRQRIPTRVALDGKPGHSRGITPFNLNRSEVDLTTSTNSFSQLKNASEWNSYPSCVSQRTEPESRLSHASKDSYLTNENKTFQGSHSNTHSAPTNSQNTSQTSGYSNQFLSNNSSQSGIPRFQVKKHDFAQSSCPSSNSPEHCHVNDAHLHTMIDHHIRAVVNERLAPELKELDNKQLSFYRRIAEADEKHIESIKAVDRKHAACIEQIKALDKRSSNIDHQFVNVTKAIAKCTVEMEKQVVEFHKKGLFVENLYHKVTEMLKSIESSTKNFNEIVEISISSIKQAHETVMESSLPFIKQKASDMMTLVVARLGLHRKDSMEVVSDSEDDEGLRMSQENNCLSKETKNSVTNFPSSEEHKGLKNQRVQNLPVLLNPLKFTKVKNDAYKPPSPLKVVIEVVVPSGKAGKPSKAAQTNVGKYRSPSATAQGKSMKQETPCKGTPNHRKYIAVTNETNMHLLPMTISKEVLSPVGRIAKISKPFQANEGKRLSPMDDDIEEKALKPMYSYRTTKLYRPNSNTTPRPSKVVSPFASIDSKHFDNVMIYTPEQSLPTASRSQTPSRNLAANGTYPVRSPSRKRQIPGMKSTKKRMRSRYGHGRSMFDDDDLEYGFLSK